MQSRRVLSIGQCAADHARIAQVLQEFGVETIPAPDLAEAREQLGAGAFRLVLINRLLDGDGSPGLDVLRALRKDPPTAELPIMLVSNYQDAQEPAVALGGLPGFGKAALSDPAVLAKLRALLG